MVKQVVTGGVGVTGNIGVIGSIGSTGPQGSKGVGSQGQTRWWSNW